MRKKMGKLFGYIMLLTVSLLGIGSFTKEAKAGIDEFQECLNGCLNAAKMCADTTFLICDWFYPSDDTAWDNCVDKGLKLCDDGFHSCTAGCRKHIPKPDPDPLPILPPEPPQYCDIDNGGGSQC